jgi:hypothetical protein
MVQSCTEQMVRKNVSRLVKMVACDGHSVHVRPQMPPFDQSVQKPWYISFAGPSVSAMEGAFKDVGNAEANNGHRRRSDLWGMGWLRMFA